jgi:chromosome segregation ATPase
MSYKTDGRNKDRKSNMSNSEERNMSDGSLPSPTVKMRILEQMAEALEDEAAGLCRRAAGHEDEETVLSREIDERQTQINRLQLKLDSIRSERYGLLGKVEDLRREANEMRYQGSSDQLDSSLDQSTNPRPAGDPYSAPAPFISQAPVSDDGGRIRSIFFHRMTIR